jgi:hypothetical protein
VPQVHHFDEILRGRTSRTEKRLKIARTAFSLGALLLVCLPYVAGAADASASPATAAVPLWLQVIDGAQKAATFLGIVLGGIAAYYKFFRGRVFHSRLDISMSSSFLRIEEDAFLQVGAQVKNTGASRVLFALNDSILTVFGANHAHRGIADESEWTIVATVDAISGGKHKWIEPAETIYLNWLIDLPRNFDYAALKSELLLSARKIVWQADTIATAQAAADAQSPNVGDRQAPGANRSRGGLRELLAAALSCLTLRGARK